jgi:hypothetical protein
VPELVRFLLFNFIKPPRSEEHKDKKTLERFSVIREMPKTLEDVADLGSYICALDKG